MLRRWRDVCHIIYLIKVQCRIKEADRVHIQSKASVNGDAET